MSRLHSAGLVDTIRALKQPLLGICVGMQLLFESSEEGDVPCIGLLPGRVRRFTGHPELPVPHMGWNQLEPARASPLLDGIDAGDYVYFVHSYAAPASSLALATTTYGDRFSSVVHHRNVFGAQFHPERSAQVGARLLQNFMNLGPVGPWN